MKTKHPLPIHLYGMVLNSFEIIKEDQTYLILEFDIHTDFNLRDSGLLHWRPWYFASGLYRNTQVSCFPKDQVLPTILLKCLSK